jgi:hypothetical protein
LEFYLHLNDTKTKIVNSRASFDTGWKYEIENFRLPVRSPSKQREAIERLLDITLKHCEDLGDARPASFFCNRLLSIRIAVENFSLVRDCILRVARDFTICLKFAARFVTQYQQLCRGPESRQAVLDWVRLLFAAHSQRAHDFEISWTLLICGVLGLKVSDQLMGMKERRVSPVVLAILGLLSAHGLLLGSWDDWEATPSGTGAIANGRNWLPFYEAVLRGWTANSEIISAIRADPLFTRLLESRVSFLDDSDFLSRAEVPSPPPSSTRVGKVDVATRIPIRAARAKGRSVEAYD